jgi:hypothetical protein
MGSGHGWLLSRSVSVKVEQEALNEPEGEYFAGLKRDF